VTQQSDLFGYQPPARYPASPGFKTAGPSEEAAKAMKPRAATIREGVLACLALSPMTPEEVAARLGIDILAVRPRFSECLKLNLVEKTTDRRRSRSGLSATVWRLVR